MRTSRQVAAGLMPKLEDVHKEFVKKFGEEPSHREGNSEVSSCSGSVGMGRSIQSRSFFSHLFSFEVSGQAQPCSRTVYACRHEMANQGNLHFVQRMPAPQCPHAGESKENRFFL